MVERGTPLQRQIVDVKPKEASPFPEDPNERFEAVFSALGNSEAKCLTLLCLSESPITRIGLHTKFLNESARVWRHNKQNQANYCRDTLIPIGLVAQADTLYFGAMEYVVGFRLTNAGKRFGQPIAAFLLEQSSKLPYSLIEIFGPTSKSSGETRPVLNTVKIFEFLSQKNTPQRVEDFAVALQLNHTLVGTHLKELSSLGFARYYSVDTEQKDSFRYTLLPKVSREQIVIDTRYPRISSDVFDLLVELKTVGCNQLARRLKDKYSNAKIYSLEGLVSKILSFFVRKKLCQREVFEAFHIHSQTEITEEGRKIVDEVIKPIRQALSGDEKLLSSWRIIPWQRYAKEAIVKYKNASGHANTRPLNEWAEEALSAIQQNPGIRPTELTSILGRSSTDLLGALLKTGKIRKQKQGKVTRYYSS